MLCWTTRALTSVIVDVVAAVGLEHVLAGVPLEPVVASAIPFPLAFRHSAVSVAVATIFAALEMQQIVLSIAI